MCGIAGLFKPNSFLSDLQEAIHCVQRMNDALAHRGPDGEGIWSDASGRCILGNRRLRVQDLSDAGKQPMISHDGRWAMAFNGEIYNADELKKQLPVPTNLYRGHSDTEVLANAIAHWGVHSLSRLDGMFALAAMNIVTGEFFLARDPFGEKPLYYQHLAGGGLAFASELTAMERLPGFTGETSLDALAELLMFEYIGAPRSIYLDILKLQPGHYLRIAPGKSAEVARYFEFTPRAAQVNNKRSLEDLADELEELLTNSLRNRMISDVPLGAFLSGGVDSSTVCALLRRKIGAPLSTFSTGFVDSDLSEHVTARQFAYYLDTYHHEQLLERSELNLLERIGQLLDEPCADWSCLPVYLLSGFARKSVTVAISGDGGDELFGGYDRYGDMLRSNSKSCGGFDPAQTLGEQYYNWGLLAMNEAAIADLFGEVPVNLSAHLAKLRQQMDQDGPTLIDKMRKTDIENYLPGAVLTKVDRMSMQHSLEVRTPYLNTRIARFAETLPEHALHSDGLGKRVLRTLARRYLPREAVDLPKKGFGLPDMQWARAEIHKTAESMLLAEESKMAGLLGRDRIRQILGRPKAVHRWWSLSMLESWCRNHPVVLPRLIDARPS